MGSEVISLLRVLRILKQNSGIMSRYRLKDLYTLFDMESFELNLGGLQLFLSEVNHCGIKKGNEFSNLEDLAIYFKGHEYSSKVVFVIDYYGSNDEFVFHGYHLPESISLGKMNSVLDDLLLRDNRYGELLNLEESSQQFTGFSLFTKSSFRTALFIL